MIGLSIDSRSFEELSRRRPSKMALPLYDVTARNRLGFESDPVLSTLESSELWLFAVDWGEGLSARDCEGIPRFWRRGGGLLSTRDHQDLGVSLVNLGGVGAVHFFHSVNRERDSSRHVRDVAATGSIAWPNYHSGRNGDFQCILAVEPLHELLRDSASASGVIEYFAAHPHEGAVDVRPASKNARAIAMGRSLTTGRAFNLAVAFERNLTSAAIIVAAQSRSPAFTTSPITTGMSTAAARALSRKLRETGSRKIPRASTTSLRMCAIWLHGSSRDTSGTRRRAADQWKAESGRPMVFKTLKRAERRRRPVRGDRGPPMNLLGPELDSQSCLPHRTTRGRLCRQGEEMHATLDINLRATPLPS
jgi:hypothetical protein